LEKTTLGNLLARAIKFTMLHIRLLLLRQDYQSDDEFNKGVGSNDKVKNSYENYTQYCQREWVSSSKIFYSNKYFSTEH